MTTDLIDVLCYVFPDGTARWVPVAEPQDQIMPEWLAQHPEFVGTKVTAGCVQVRMPRGLLPEAKLGAPAEAEALGHSNPQAA